MNVVNPEKIAQLENLTLHEGGHSDFTEGHCAMEVVSWLADEGFTDAPECASPFIRRYAIALNDRWDDEKRQLLKPYLIRMIGTGSDGKDAIRERIALDHLSGLVGPWLRLTGLDQEADALAKVDSPRAARDALRVARDAAWAIRVAKRKELRDLIEPKIKAELEKRGKAADAAAAAVAAADAVADADAAAAAAADADAVAAAVADAAAAAVAAAAADADAVAAAAAAADAVAAAVAAADAVAAAAAVAAAVADAVAVAVAASTWDGRWSAAYTAARKYYRENPLPISEEIANLAAEQDGTALALLDRLIEAE